MREIFWLSYLFVLLPNGKSSLTPTQPHNCTEPACLIKDIDDNNWPQLLQGEWLVLLCAPMRQECKRLDLVWLNFAAMLRDPHMLNIGYADLSVSLTLISRLSVHEVPTIYHIKDAQFRKCALSLRPNAFLKLIYEQEWQTYPLALNYWQHPQSIYIALSVAFFKACLALHKTGILGYDFRLANWCVSALIVYVLSLPMGLGFMLLNVYRPVNAHAASVHHYSRPSRSRSDSVELYDDLPDALRRG